MIGGDGAVGKSLLLEQLGVAVAAESEWIGTLPEPGPAVFVSAEDELDELHRRLSAIADKLGVDISSLTDLHFIPLAGKDAILAAPQSRAGILAPTSNWRSLVSIVEQIRPRLVVLDTLADVFAGEENVRTQARQFIGLLRGLAIDQGLAVVLAAHPSLSGISTGSGTSGSTAWSNSVRSRLYLERIKDKDGREIDADLRVLRAKKTNYGPQGLEVRLRWSNGVFVLDRQVGGLDKLAEEAKAERVFLDLLTAFKHQGRDVSAKPSRTYAPVVFERNPGAEGVTKRAFESAMERLLTRGSIYVDTSGPPSKPRSRIAITSPTESGRDLPTLFQPPSNGLPTPSNGVFLPTPYNPRGVGTPPSGWNLGGSTPGEGNNPIGGSTSDERGRHQPSEGPSIGVPLTNAGADPSPS
jgi:RecA-family ATPase